MGAGVSKQVVSHVGKMQLRKLSLYMEGIMNLSEKVWNILNDDDANRLLLSQTYSELRLDESSVFSTFRSDLAILIGRSLAIFDSDSFPYWLKTQLLAQHIAQSCKTPITLETFENICKLVRRLRVQGKFDVSRSIFDGEKSAMVAYIWDDQDLLAFCCMILLNHLQSDLMKPQSVDRISDEHLQVAFVLIQPVIGQYPDLFRHLFTVLEARQKFSFRQFFDFIISPEIVSEFSLLLGKVVMELRSESPSVGVSVHKTRGANRESTEALQADLQRHAFFMTSTGNHLFEAIQNYLTAETLTIIRILFPAVDNASPKRLKTA
ncbi:uncharacterized protein LOC129584629 [Paramacrobiotus metropolitanus]|uniref:uncharacterized protein LOC129584629 n=1 Tax=Paramacrobiotus metropolitanus TaxID=2943436 RepID=UPI0024461B9F|nr:uncharacterized protein LOC129584629 [Paramacrobiotus metropolitanus]XP_055332845.1 uncharacterized protein LOC129584629 [Paramacrobiotus metropolitanus]